ncbi:MAG: L-threonylcarbamoyladenylate synthase [Sphingomonadales bacterium]
MQTQVLAFSDDAIAVAANIIADGGVVAVPTETVYGLAGDATSDIAVAAIYAAKGRPSFNPLIVHVPDLDGAMAIGDFSGTALDLAKAHWPGPLTIVVPLRADAGIAKLTTAGLATIAIRVPAHRAMQALLHTCGRPLAAPSANASGTISPTRAEHVLRSLDGRIPLVIDDGATPGGIESTIVKITDDQFEVLRPGPVMIIADSIRGSASAAAAAKIEAPGQLAAHYAPSKPLRLNANSAQPGEILIGFGPVGGDMSLSPSGNTTEAAVRLFDLLHAADANPAPRIAIAPIPDEGLGIAVNDRLRRAATGAAHSAAV